MEGLCWREDVLDWFLLEVVVVDAVEDDVNDVRQEILQNQHVCVLLSTLFWFEKDSRDL